jgi:hypothetical protein
MELSIRGYSLTEITRNPEKLPAAKKYIYDRLVDGRFHPHGMNGGGLPIAFDGPLHCVFLGNSATRTSNLSPASPLAIASNGPARGCVQRLWKVDTHGTLASNSVSERRMSASALPDPAARANARKPDSRTILLGEFRPNPCFFYLEHPNRLESVHASSNAA